MFRNLIIFWMFFRIGLVIDDVCFVLLCRIWLIWDGLLVRCCIFLVIGVSLVIVRFERVGLKVENCWLLKFFKIFFLVVLVRVVQMLIRLFVFGCFFSLLVLFGSVLGFVLVFLILWEMVLVLFFRLIWDRFEGLDLDIFLVLLCSDMIWVVGLVIIGFVMGKQSFFGSFGDGVGFGMLMFSFLMCGLKLLLNFVVMLWVNFKCCF